LNVLKPQLQSTVFTLLDRQTSQRQIQKLTGVDRKTIRRYRALLAAAEAKSPGEVTTGSESGESQIPPPRPPALEAPVTSLTSGVRLRPLPRRWQDLLDQQLC
jgi:hypothetical protein